LLLAALAGCGNPEPVPLLVRDPSMALSVDSTPAEHEHGRRIYNYRCYFCHGYSGDARTLASTYLSPQPRDFTAEPARALAPSQLQQAIAEGRSGTAMKAFRGVLSDADIAAVAAFVRHEFIDARAVNTRYHTAANGWPDHERHRAAFPFARGELALDTPWEQLDPTQRRGKQLFLTSCISCHDRARVDDAGAVWETRALSYPRDAYCTSCHEHPDGSGLRVGVAPPSDDSHSASTASHDRNGDAALAATYAVHDRRPVLRGAGAQVLEGERLYQRDCAFCHAADGSAKSWIGRFLEPHPRDLTDARAMAGMTRERLTSVITDGLDGTSMPAWKSVLRPEEIEAVAAYVERAFIAPRSR
jgi:cytochrome c oxidase cbb3-type subunit 3